MMFGPGAAAGSLGQRISAPDRDVDPRTLLERAEPEEGNRQDKGRFGFPAWEGASGAVPAAEPRQKLCTTVGCILFNAPPHS